MKHARTIEFEEANILRLCYVFVVTSPCSSINCIPIRLIVTFCVQRVCAQKRQGAASTKITLTAIFIFNLRQLSKTGLSTNNFSQY